MQTTMERDAILVRGTHYIIDTNHGYHHTTIVLPEGGKSPKKVGELVW